jgi:3-dehydrosphinganine reductase
MLKLILAGILAIPCFLVALVSAPLIAILAIPPLLLLIYRTGDSPGPFKKLPDHVVIAGGSSGIGLCIAHECVRRGVAKVTLLARNPEKLEAAKQLLETTSSASALTTTTTIHTRSVSVSDYSALQTIASEMGIAKEDRVVLFNCAGIPYTTEFETVPVEQFGRLVHTNQLGAMYLVRAFLPQLQQGCIVLTCSAAAQVGCYGYTAYSPTKYALRGFAETLHAELTKSHPNVSIQLAFPADTNTPGYEEEKKMMPEITKACNESAGLANPEE